MTSKTINKVKSMITFPRLGFYLLAWLLLVTITVIISSQWLVDIDEWVYLKFDKNETNAQFEDKIILIDLPKDSLNLEEFRHETALLLNTINSMAVSQSQLNSNNNSFRKPKVILDLTYGISNDGIDTLRKSIERLKSNSINVYGAYTLPDDDKEIFFDTYNDQKNKILYDSVFVGGRLHPNYSRNGCIISYDSYKDIPRDTLGNLMRIESLIVRVAKDNAGITESDFEDKKVNNVPTDSIIERFTPRTYQFAHTLNIIDGKFKNFNEDLNLNGAFVIVGRFDVDIFKICDKSIPGPYLLASGLLNELQPDDAGKLSNEAHKDIPVQIGMAILFALFVCVFFALIYKYLKKLQTKPLLIGVLAFILGILFLIAVGFILLRIEFIIRPALPGVCMFWASFLAWRFTRKFLVTGIMDGGEVYDVFISYSFGDSTWVKQNLFEPLNEFKKPDGKRLKIFFAEKSIGIGELFTSKYMRAIVDSKFFIPVMSEEYYKKNHCKNEMDLAVKRKIEKLINLCIVALDYKYVPEEFTNINYVDITKQTDFMTALKKEIVKVEQDQLDESTNDSDISSDVKIMEQKATIESIEVDQQEKEEKSEKKEKKLSDKKDKKSKKKNKKEEKKKDKKKSKKDKKKIKKEEKEKTKKATKKAEKKKDKKKSDKRQKDKKSKKGSDKKEKKSEKEKTKKGSEKKVKKAKKGKK